MERLFKYWPRIVFAVAFVVAGIGGTLGFQHLTSNRASISLSHVAYPPQLHTIDPKDNWADAWKIDPTSGEITKRTATSIPRAESDSSDSQVTTDAKATFNTYFVDNPAFDCPNGRNVGKTWREMNKFTPCVNGSALLQLKDGKITVINATTVVVTHNGVIAGSNNDVTYHDGNWDVSARSAKTAAGKPGALIGYDSDQSYWMFETYASVDNGPWQLIINPNDKTWDSRRTVRLELTWQDPTKPMLDAPVPFNWKDVAKNAGAPGAVLFHTFD